MRVAILSASSSGEVHVVVEGRCVAARHAGHVEGGDAEGGAKQGGDAGAGGTSAFAGGDGDEVGTAAGAESAAGTGSLMEYQLLVDAPTSVERLENPLNGASGRDNFCSDYLLLKSAPRREAQQASDKASEKDHDDHDHQKHT